jgi:hypothetical protein
MAAPSPNTASFLDMMSSSVSGTTIAPNTFNVVTAVLDSGVAANTTRASQPHPLSVFHPPPPVTNSGAAQEKDGWTPLHFASQNGYLDLVRFLLEHGADPTAQNHGRTPLQLASRYGHLDVARFLLEHGADTAAQEKDGGAPLHLAFTNGHLDLARFLIEHGADAQNYPSGTSTQDSDTRHTNPVANTTSTAANNPFPLSLAHWELTRSEEAQPASRSDCDDDVPPPSLVIDATHDPDGVKELGFMNEQPPLAMDELGETVHEVSALPSPSQEHVFTPRPVPLRISKPPDKLHPTLSCWLKNMSKLSSLIDRLQELTSSAPPEHRAQLSNQVETLRATFKKQQERCIDFLQLSEEYASKYLNHISAEIQQQSSFLEMLEKRLDMAKLLHRQAVDLRRSYESGTVANIRDVRATGKATSCHLQRQNVEMLVFSTVAATSSGL